jgi:hypothetical protein
VYVLAEEAWTRHKYADDPTWISYVRSGLTPLTINELDTYASSIDGLSSQFASIDSMVGPDDGLSGMLLCTPTAVVAEDSTTAQDDFGSGAVDANIVTATGVLTAGSMVHETSLLWITVLYEHEGPAQTLVFEYSVNAGTTWNTYGTEVVDATSYPTTLQVRRTVSGYSIMTRMRATTVGTLKLHGFVPPVQLGRPIRDQI